MDWNDPKERFELLERVGATEYNKLYEAHRKSITVATVNGYRIVPVQSRFGQLYLVEGKDQAFRTVNEAVAFADGCEPKP